MQIILSVTYRLCKFGRLLKVLFPILDIPLYCNSL